MACKLFFVFLCILFQVYCQSLKDVDRITDTFFNNLMKKYESSVLTNETKALIDQEIDNFVNSILKNLLYNSRHKKELFKHSMNEKDVEVFSDLEEVLKLNATDISDLHFFKKHNQFYQVLITSTDLFVYQINDIQAFPIAYHSVPYMSKLHVCKFSGTTWFIVKHAEGITVLHFFQQNGRFTIQEVEYIDIPNVKHFAVWQDQMHVFLSISSASAFHVYTRLENKFRLIEFLPIVANSSAFFATDKSTNLVILGHSKTTILKYMPHGHYFDAYQSIPKSFNDITTVRISHDYFLVLSSSQRTILYKLSDSVYVPLQEIAPADQVVSVARNTTMVLLLRRNYLLNVYQYDGWRFVRLDYELDGIENLKSITLRGEAHLIIITVNGSWILTSLNWSKAKGSSEYLKNLKQWCMAAKDKAKAIPKIITDRRPIEASNVNLHKVTVDSVNGISTEKLKQLNDSYYDLVSRLQAAKDVLTEKRTLKDPKLSTLRAKAVRVKCFGKCYINNLVTELPFDITSKLRRIDDGTLSLKFEKVHVDTLEGFPCPSMGIKLEDVNVEGLINGISFEDLYKNALRTSGDQIVTGIHKFDEVRVDSIIAPNIEAASTFTRQNFKTKAIRAKELNLTDGGLLLPLDGEPVTMTGTLTAKKVAFSKLVVQRGGITGKSIKKIAPMVSFPDYYNLTGNYTLSNVKVTDLLMVKDITRKSGKSLKEIVDNVIPLNEGVPVHLHFSENRTLWSNITVENLPNWLTRKNAQMVKVTGEKIALKDIILPDDVFSQLPLPKVETPVCTVVAVTPDLRTSSIEVGQATAKTVVVEDVEGADDLEKLVSDCASSWDEVDLSKKVFTGPVFIENLNLTSFKGSPFESFETAMFKWYDPQILKGPIKMKNLNVSLLNAAEGIKVPLPTEIQSLTVEGNLEVKTINDVDLNDFLRNIVRINEPITLKNVKFEGSVEADEIETVHTNIHLEPIEANLFLGNKTIIGDLNIEGDFSIPDNEAYSSLDKVTTYVIDGSVTFKKEPNVVNINGKNLKELIAGIWMLDQPISLAGDFLLNNVTLLQPFDSFDLLNTQNFGPWATVESRLLSKTKLQEIPSTLNFRNAKMPNIITTGNSFLNSSDLYFNDLLNMTLKKDVDWTITDKWRFEELIVTGDLILQGKINNLNLFTDVARHDVKVNMITGKKTVKGLTAKHLHGLNFNKWAKDALMQSGTEKPVVITGRKTFNNLRARILKVNGTVMGKRIEKCLRASGDQVITEPKLIKGSLHSPSILLGGLINGMNFTDVALNQLTKNASVQSFKSDIKFSGNLHILGNLTIKRLKGVEMPDINSINKNLSPLTGTIDYLKPYATAIGTAYKNRAKYWYKFEEVKGRVLLPVNEYSPPVTLTLHQLGNCIFISVFDLECSGQNRYHLKPLTNSSNMVVSEILSVDSVTLVVQVSSGPGSRITIYQYEYRANTFIVSESIRVPGISDASVLSHNRVVWIVALLNTEMLVVRYETWGDIQKYHMPSSSHFVLNKVEPTNEPILVRDDGMWKFEGLAGPWHAFKADLTAENIETFNINSEFFVRLTYRIGDTRLLRARYVGV
ncbi:uncharacterized protein LOC131674652 isoform X2 [Phymastichus coffea]|uniref:uncharacterized protein LOC131674652 isoform X2 n=1 Tax=Phymastichus coffea TaxID=108790 RepID=UPI00273C1D8D|nr:uncharacterized protein LOC131674652 isoform X2 [Phymastichus coffea]